MVSPCVLTEFDYLVASRMGPDPGSRGAGLHQRPRCHREVGGPAIGPYLVAAHALLGDYPAIGLADAMNVVLAMEFRTDVIATLDQRHFRMIRPLTRHDAFRLLPHDVPAE